MGVIVKQNQVILVHESGSCFPLTWCANFISVLFVRWLECMPSVGCIWRQQLVAPGGTNTGIPHKKNLKTVTYPVRAPSCYPPRFNTACLRFFTAASEVSGWKQVSRNEGDPVKRGIVTQRGCMYIYCNLTLLSLAPWVFVSCKHEIHEKVWFLIAGSISQKSTSWFFFTMRAGKCSETRKPLAVQQCLLFISFTSWSVTDGKAFMQQRP